MCSNININLCRKKSFFVIVVFENCVSLTGTTISNANSIFLKHQCSISHICLPLTILTRWCNINKLQVNHTTLLLGKVPIQQVARVLADVKKLATSSTCKALTYFDKLKQKQQEQSSKYSYCFKINCIYKIIVLTKIALIKHLF